MRATGPPLAGRLPPPHTTHRGRGGKGATNNNGHPRLRLTGKGLSTGAVHCSTPLSPLRFRAHPCCAPVSPVCPRVATWSEVFPPLAPTPAATPACMHPLPGVEPDLPQLAAPAPGPAGTTSVDPGPELPALNNPAKTFSPAPDHPLGGPRRGRPASQRRVGAAPPPRRPQGPRCRAPAAPLSPGPLPPQADERGHGSTQQGRAPWPCSPPPPPPPRARLQGPIGGRRAAPPAR